MENKGSSTMAPLLFRNLIAPLYIYADKSFLNLAQKYKFIQIFRYLFTYSFLFLLRLIPSSLNPSSPSDYHPLKPYHHHHVKPEKPQSNTRDEDSGIARALSQLLSIMNKIPVSSRKYETVRCLAEKLIDENFRQDCPALSEVNRTVLSAAFSRTLSQLEASMLVQERERLHLHGGVGVASGSFDYGLNRVLRAVQNFGDGARSRFRLSRVEENRLPADSAEKLAAELLWLAEKLVACGCAEEAVSRWGSASSLAWLAISAEPRLQGSLVKLSALLFKQAKEIGEDEEEEEEKVEGDGKGKSNEGNKKQQQKMKILMSWLPLLCRANNGSDAPVLNGREKAEIERVLEEIIEMLKEEEEQEKVLSLWLHHFTSCPSSDWPNLQVSYSRWCDASRKQLLVP